MKLKVGIGAGLAASLALSAAMLWPSLYQQPETRQATGVKVGEVTQTSAIVWMRVTANATRNAEGPVRMGRNPQPLEPHIPATKLRDAAPGAPGQVQLRYSTREDLSNGKSTGWADVTETTDFSHQFQLAGLSPATTYYYSAETAGPGGSPRHGALRGSFKTAPAVDKAAPVTFAVVTGMMYNDLDDPRGFHIYDAMQKLNPDFLVLTGDTVYYDSENPQVNSMASARFHWQRMYSLPRLVDFHLRVPAYWEKDDHDTLSNDSWPTMNPGKMAPFTFREGQRVFLEQVPMGDKIYRTIRWGKSLQIWLTEGRDFRSPNNAPDGPEKTIYGKEQKEWLKKSLLASTADWKVLVNPTPIVGPDRGNKGDNHANRQFAYAGNELRTWFKENVPNNFFVACGDRHWQYHSVDPKTGVIEFSSGPASNEHASGSPGENSEYHKFHRVQGGFLSVSVKPEGEKSTIAFRFHDVKGNVVYEWEKR